MECYFCGFRNYLKDMLIGKKNNRVRVRNCEENFNWFLEIWIFEGYLIFIMIVLWSIKGNFLKERGVVKM